MTVAAVEDGFRYTSERAGAEFSASYRPTSDLLRVEPDSLEHWLTERYCLYASAPDGSIWRNDVHHHPWPLQLAEANIERNTMFEAHGLTIREPPTLVHFAKQIDVVVWDAERVT
jgi:uncharacterized protein YqjF (DUF2071 family)